MSHAAGRYAAPLRLVPVVLACVGGFVASRALPLAASELRMTPIVKAVQAARPSVVNIRGEKTLAAASRSAGVEADRRVNGMGTGIVIDERGYILTNHHVVDGVHEIEVTLHDGVRRIARLVAHDVKTDLAIIKIDASTSLQVINIGTSGDLLTGETVIAVGNAYGYEHTVTRGIISALHRSVEVGEGQRYDDLIQTDASINPGNSGGPLLNIDGEMIGVNVAVRAGAQGIGFAIPVDRAMQIAAELLSARRVNNLWLGVVTRKQRGDQHGVAVDDFEEASPASASQLAVGDVIVAVDGRSVNRRLDLERALLDHHSGDDVELVVRRDGQKVSVPLRLATVPEDRRKTDDPVWETLGLELKAVSPARFRQFESGYRGGLSVVAVRPNSPAAKQGIRSGDVLVGMHVWETVSLDHVRWVLNRGDFDQFDPVKFYILRGNETLYGHMTVSLQNERAAATQNRR